MTSMGKLAPRNRLLKARALETNVIVSVSALNSVRCSTLYFHVGHRSGPVSAVGIEVRAASFGYGYNGYG